MSFLQLMEIAVADQLSEVEKQSIGHFETDVVGRAKLEKESKWKGKWKGKKKGKKERRKREGM